MPAVKSRKPRTDAVRNRERILNAATELVRQEGEKVAMAQIAQHAGVGVGTLYRHFASREDLLAALVHRSFGIAVENAMAAAAQTGSALDSIRSFFLATLRDRERFVLPLHGGPPVFTPATRRLQADVRTILRSLLERGQADGELRADLTPEDLIVAASLLSRPLAGTEPAHVARPGSDWDRIAARQIELLLHGLGNTPRRQA